MSSNGKNVNDLYMSERNKPFLSIVIPVYNVEQYLETCIKSLLVQEYKNFEMILVDDGSTDRSSVICDNYANKDRRIIVLHKENSGLSDARNQGTKIAHGKYLLYVDSDDFILDRYFLGNARNLIENAAYPIDLIVFGYRKYYGKDDKKVIKLPIKESYIEGTIADICERGCFKISAWGKILRMKMVEKYQINFREGVLSEDMEWCAKLITHCEYAIAWNTTPYAYRQRKESISKSVSLKHINDLEYNMIQCFEIEKRCENSKLNIYKTYMAMNVSMYFIVLSRMEERLWHEKKSLLREWTKYLSYGIRPREQIMAKSIRRLGIEGTLKLLKIYDFWICRK